jgi:WD40 repeat protein
MGEVYRAHDARLQRDVAVKVLHGDLLKDAPRLLRFEKEALAVSALSHPNILTLYDVGTYDGIPYMVAELLEGKTLRDRLDEGLVPLRKAVDYALQIAAGLAAAHDKGIIHRDLKPENLLLTPDGRVKILDFGLAKLTHAEAPAPTTVPLESARTAPGNLRTDPAMMMGTPGYMSPEQLQGLPVTARSDIFAFGLVLYELLYGRRAFARPSPIEVSLAILKEDPQMDAASGRAVPLMLQRVVQRCLEKDPNERFHSARDIAYALEALSASSEDRSALGQLLGEAQTVRRSPVYSRRAVLAAGGAGLVASSAIAFLLGRRSQRPAVTDSPYYRRLTFRHGVIDNARFGPDGTTVIYGAAWEQSPHSLYEVRIDQPQSRLLHSDAFAAAVSSQGELAMIHIGGDDAAAPTLARVPLWGGSPRAVLTGVHGADWSPDGTQLAVVCSADDRYRVEYPIGRILYQTTARIGNLRVSPDGKHVAFLEHPIVGDTGGMVSVVDVHGQYRPLTERFNHLVSLAFAPSGQEIWFSGTQTGILSSLWSVGLHGRPRVLLRVAGSLRIHDVSRTGRALVTQDKYQCGTVARPRGSMEERELSWFDFTRAVDLSADGSTLLFDESGEGGGAQYSTYLRRLDGSPAVRLGEGSAMALSPDGRWALAMVPGHTQQLVLWPTGAGQPIVLPNPGLTYQSTGRFTPDSKHVLWSATSPGQGVRWYRQSILGGEPEPILNAGVDIVDISPDGQWMLGGSCCELEHKQVTLYSLSGGEPRPVRMADGRKLDKITRPLRFGEGGNSVLLWHNASDPRRRPTRIEQLDLMTGKARCLLELRPADLTGFAKILTLTATADAQVYAYSCLRSATDLFLLDGLV